VAGSIRPRATPGRVPHGASVAAVSSADQRRDLLYSYYLPPIGGPSAHRPLSMARYLAELGYASVIVTGAGATSDRWAPDEALGGDASR
jgi:hypothetical protein